MNRFRFRVPGEQRKALVRTLSNLLGEDAVYLGAPSFAYQVDGYTVSRDGTLSFPDGIAPHTIDLVLASLRAQGFFPEETALVSATFVVEVPRAGFSREALENLRKIIASKAVLFKKSIGTDILEVEVTDMALRFPWFALHDLDGEADAYTRFVTALCKMAREQKRVTARARDIQNEKFAMRLFLIRLGFIGNEYKTARKILLRNLTGNSSWKDGHPPVRISFPETEEQVRHGK